MQHVAALFLRLSLIGLLVPGACSHAASISVEMQSGRRFTGELDRRTSPESLWLRAGRAGAEVRRPLDWRHIRQIEVAGESYTPAEVQTVVLSSAWAAQDPFVDDVRSVTAASLTPETVPAPPPVFVARQAVRSLQVQAYAASWDADVPADGVIVCIQPLDCWGMPVAVSGSLEVSLMGQWRGVPTGSYGTVPLGRTTTSLTPADFGPSGYECRLPFQYASPEFDARLVSFGIVHARLSVPGDGVFEASAATVRVRPYSALRDRFEQLGGTRFLPDESTGNVPGEYAPH